MELLNNIFNPAVMREVGKKAYQSMPELHKTGTVLVNDQSYQLYMNVFFGSVLFFAFMFSALHFLSTLCKWEYYTRMGFR